MELIEKNFILRKDYLGKGFKIKFVNIHGHWTTYNHDELFSLIEYRLTQLPCWIKYGLYTNSRDIPVYMQEALGRV